MFLDYLELTFRNGDRFREGISEWVHRSEERRVFHQDLICPLEMGTKNKVRVQQRVCYKPEDEIQELNLEEHRDC